MKKRRSWFMAVVVLAIALGIATYWYVDDWLMPGPQVYSIKQLTAGRESNRGHFYDLSLRWLCVHVSVPDEAQWTYDKTHQVFDLDQQGKQINEFIWKRPPGGLITQQQRYGGTREVYHQTHKTDSDLLVVDQSFLDGKSKTHRLGIYGLHMIAHVLVAEEGERLIVIYRVPLRALSILASVGQSPFVNYVPVDYTCIADVWEVSSGKLVKQIMLGMPNWGEWLLSGDGQWLVQLEMESEPFSVRPNKAFEVKPAIPRGVLIINTTTGERRTILEKPYEAESFGAYDGKIIGKQLMVFHSKITNQSATQFSVSFRNHGSTMYDLATGNASSWAWTDPWLQANDAPQGLGTPGWLAYQRVQDRGWPSFLRKMAEWMNYDLNSNHPLGLLWETTFFDADTREIRYQKTVTIPNHQAGGVLHGQSNGSNALVMESYKNNSLEQFIYRWKVPFTVYSPWWSRSAGVLVVILVMATYWLICRRR
ncbi:MAG TPA: hypothetical protein PLN21_06910 [Gemmatales bacterium]|nr:hypothetical protein [Gemmatales bacterium]